MDSLWIVHDEGPARAAIARLAGVAPSWSGSVTEAVAGGPRDSVAPEAIILGVGPRVGDALEAARQLTSRHPNARWVLLHHPGVDLAELGRRFAALGASVLRWPPPATALRRALARRDARPESHSLLASRRQRDALVRRFSRSFGDLELPNPIGNGGPLLLVGEAGSGRLLLARVVHALAERPGRFVHIPCEPGADLGDLSRRLEALGGEEATLCLEHPEALAPAAQRELRGWVELGPPIPGVDPEGLQWIGLVDEAEADSLAPELEGALSGLEIRIPPLRERPGVAEAFAETWLADWFQGRGSAGRPLDHGARAALAGDYWPGNLRELEETLRRAVATGGTGPITATDLGVPAPAGRSREQAASSGAELPAASPPPALEAAAPESASMRAEAPSSGQPVAPSKPAPVGVPSIARALSHELGNPMVSLRTFAQLLPERYEDPAFREDFRYQVEKDLARIDDRLSRLQEYAELRPAEAKPVDVCALVEELLNERRGLIGERSLLVLRELEDERPSAMGDPDRLRFAFASLLDAAFDAVADRADLYVACRHHPRGLNDRPAMRVLVRFHTERTPAALPGASENGEHELSLLLARQTIERLGGRLTVDSTEADERVLLVDLPAPA